MLLTSYINSQLSVMKITILITRLLMTFWITQQQQQHIKRNFVYKNSLTAFSL